MKRVFLLTLAIILLVSLIPSVVADDTVNLLAVSEHGNKSVGGTAQMKLTTSDGTGEIFFNTYPFARIDTQISGRMANAVACKYVSNCDLHDYYYSISIDSPSIGGPSAGAAITLLTMSNMMGHEIDDNFAITGTINGGGIIGPVGGVEEKVKAAVNSGMSKVVIPFGSDKITKFDNNKPKLFFDEIQIYLIGDDRENIAEFDIVNNTLTLEEESEEDYNFSTVKLLYLNNNDPLFTLDFETNLDNTQKFVNFFENNFELFTQDQIIEHDNVFVEIILDKYFEYDVPKLSDLRTNFTYELDLVEWGREKGAIVMPTVDILDAYHLATGYKLLNQTNKTFQIPTEYDEILNSLSNDLCSEFQRNIKEFDFDINISKYEDIDPIIGNRVEALENNSKKIDQLLNGTNHYTAASVCFSNSIGIDHINFMTDYADGVRNEGYYYDVLDYLIDDYNEYQTQINKLEINSLIDIQTIGIIKNRLREVERYFEEIEKMDFNESKTQFFYSLAFAKHRLQTAKSWKLFYGNGKQLNLDDESLHRSCNTILVEVQERYSYITTIVDNPLDELRHQINEINTHYNKGDFVSCIYESGVIKARLEHALTSGGFNEENQAKFYELKKQIVAKNVAHQMENGYFPILGYSYLEYADYLKNTSYFEALHFLSLSLELNNLDLYLPSEVKANNSLLGAFVKTGVEENVNNAMYLAMGLLLGFMLIQSFKRRTIVIDERQRQNLVKLTRVKVVRPDDSDKLFGEKESREKKDLFENSFKSKLFEKLK